MNWLESLLIFAVVLPGVAFAALAVVWLAGVNWRERHVVWITASMFTLVVLSLAIVAVGMLWLSQPRLVVNLGDWFDAGGYHFPAVLLADFISLPLMALTAILTGLVGSFSARYMHREGGFLYFFLLLQLFAFGSLLLFAAGSLDLLVAGWEFVGITSVLLIAFFHQRREPVHSALRVFAVYRTCDLGLLVGVVVLHHFLGSTSLIQSAALAGPVNTVAGFLLLLAAAGKAAQFPLSGWLPRAMEGPTPSSAIFYGAISVHAGAYLLLRSGQVLEPSAWVQGTTIALGALSAVFATLIGRACTDAKTSLAWASVTQLGVIFVEIGLGFPSLAVWHICGHAMIRTLQFLRAPSALHEFHQIHAAAGGHLEPVGLHHEALLPLPVRLWLYRLALDRGHMDTFLDRMVVTPVLNVSRFLNRSEPPVPASSREPRLSSTVIAGPADV